MFRITLAIAVATATGCTVGDSLPVRVEGIDGELEGRLAEIQPASDAVSRTRLFKIDLPDTPGLRSGQFGRALLAGAPELTVMVPVEAIVHHGQLESVFVVESGTARIRLVRSGRERSGQVEISSGLAGGETVAVVGAGLVDGERVEEAR